MHGVVMKPKTIHLPDLKDLTRKVMEEEEAEEVEEVVERFATNAMEKATWQESVLIL